MSTDVERIAVLETQVHELTGKIDTLMSKIDVLMTQLAEARGAARLVSWLAVFLGVSTAAALVTRWRELLHWLGS